jgi:hypothetical protein
MKTFTIETTFENGKILIPKNLNINESMRVLVVFIENIKTKRLNKKKFSFKKSLDLTKICNGNISDLVIEKRRNEKW